MVVPYFLIVPEIGLSRITVFSRSNICFEDDLEVTVAMETANFPQMKRLVPRRANNETGVLMVRG